MRAPWKTTLFALLVLAACFAGACAASDASSDPDFDGDDYLDAAEPVAAPQDNEPPVPVPISTAHVDDPSDYKVEIFGAACIVAYALIYVVGRSKNDAISSAWGRHVVPQLSNQFALVGVGKEGSETAVLKRSQHMYTSYATGRRNVVGMIMDLNLKKRQDLLSLVLQLAYPERDMLTVELPLREAPGNNVSQMAFVLAVCRHKAARSMHTNNTDLFDFASLIPRESLPAVPSWLSVMSDSREIAAELLKPEVCRVLEAHEELFESLHITDHAKPLRVAGREVGQKAVRLQLRLPPAERMEEVWPLLEMVLSLADLVAEELQPSSQALAETRSLRRKLQEQQRNTQEEQEKRDAEAEARRLEKLRRREEEYAGLSREAKQKWDEKEEKKKMRKQMGKRKMRVMMV